MSGPGSRCSPRSPQDWAAQVAGWHARAVALAGGAMPEPDTEYLLWQTLAGAWPIDSDRLTGYLRKAMREAKTAPPGPTRTTTTRRRCWASPSGCWRTRSSAAQIAGFVAGLAATRGRTHSASSSSSSPCPAWPTSTRAASWPACAWSTRTTGGRPTSPAAGTCSAALDAGQPPAGLDAPGRGEAAGHLGRAAAAPGPPGLVRGGVPAAGGRGPGGAARGRLRPRRPGGHRGHPAARRAARAAAAGPAPCCRCRTPAPGGIC